jgi:phycobilisome rod-core linker protein
MINFVQMYIFLINNFTMNIPLKTYAPSSQNQRVKGFEIPGDEQPKLYTTEGSLSTIELNELIWAAYRQIFNEQQMLFSNRQLTLESQLKHKSITVRDFIRGLILSEKFRIRNYDTNSNYRFVEMCIQRVLGRNVYSQQEKIAWSIVLGTKGLQGFVDAMLSSEEYQNIFGDHTVPYQRRRIISQRHLGDLSFSQFPRYDQYHRQQLEKLGYFQGKAPLTYRWKWQQDPYTKVYQAISLATLFAGITLVALGTVVVILSYYGLISL